MNIFRYLLKRPVSIIMLFTVTCVFGFISITRLKITLLPDIAYPKLTIMTFYSNVPPREIEELVTSPIEEAIMSVNGVKRVESISRESVSIVIPVFTWGTDLDVASMDVREKLDTIKNILPKKVQKPVVIKLDPSSKPIIGIGVFGNAGDKATIKRLIDKEIKPEFERQEGIARVSIKGGVKEEIQININLDRMNAFGLSLDDIKNKISSASYNFPAGTIVEGKKEYLIRVDGEYKTIYDIMSTRVGSSQGGGAVMVSDIGTVKFGFKDRTSYFLFDDKEGIGLDIIKEQGANDILVSKRVKKLIKKINRKFGSFLQLQLLYDNSDFITESVRNLLITAILAVIITFFVILLFMKNPMHSIIITVTVPVSILISFSCMYFSGMTLNIMSIGGLVLGIGMLVDNAIVIIEVIEGQSEIEGIVKKTSSVALPLFASTSTTLIVFIPLLFVKGIAGSLFGQLALTISFSLLSSIVVSLFLIPVLYFIAGQYGKTASPVWFLRVQGLFFKVLSTVMRHKKTVIVVVVLFVLLIGVFGYIIRKEFMPLVDRGTFSLNIRLDSGTPIEENRRIVSSLMDTLRKVPEVSHVYASLGYEQEDLFSFLKEDVGEHMGEVIVLLKERRKRSVFKVVSDLSEKLGKTGSINMVFEVPRNVVAEVLNIGKHDFSIELLADDRHFLDAYSEELKLKLSQSGLFTRVESSKKPGKPQLKVTFDQEALIGSTISSRKIYTLLATAIKGEKTSFFEKDDDRLDITLRFAKTDRQDIEDISRFKLYEKEKAGSEGENTREIPIISFIKYKKEQSPSKILRKNQKEIIKLFGNYRKGGKQSENKTVRLLAGFKKSRPGLSVDKSDEQRELEESFKQLGFALLLSLFLVYALLASQFESLTKPLLIMFSVPFAFLGSLVLLIITGSSININSILGIVMLSGIVVNNSIILFDRYSRIPYSGSRTLVKGILTETRLRFKPVLMTTCTTICGLIPMAVGIGRGGKLQTPLALAVIGGLVLSTIITLFIMPGQYFLIEETKQKKIQKKTNNKKKTEQQEIDKQ